jgi:hypothetical protein
MVFATAARALNLEVDVAFYMISNVVGLCARFINSDPAFLPQNPAAYTEKKLDETTQKNAKKSLTAFIKGLNNQDAPMMLRRGYAYRRAFKSAAVAAYDSLFERVGFAAAEVLHGEWLSYELLSSWCDEENGDDGEDGDEDDTAHPLVDCSSRAVDGLWTVAGNFADSIAARDSQTWCEGFARLTGIGPDGMDLRDDGVATVTNLVKAARRKPGQTISALNAGYFGPAEVDIRKRLAGLVPTLSDIAARYEANLVRLTTERRAVEHQAHPEIGAPEPDVVAVIEADKSLELEDVVLHGIEEDDKKPLCDALHIWYEAVALRLIRRRESLYADYIKRLNASFASSGLVAIKMPKDRAPVPAN